MENSDEAIDACEVVVTTGEFSDIWVGEQYEWDNTLDFQDLIHFFRKGPINDSHSPQQKPHAPILVMVKFLKTLVYLSGLEMAT